MYYLSWYLTFLTNKDVSFSANLQKLLLYCFNPKVAWVNQMTNKPDFSSDIACKLSTVFHEKYKEICHLLLLYLALKALNWKTIFSQFHLNVNPKDISADQTHISRLVFTAFNVENAADKIGFQSCYPYKLASDLRELIQTRHRWKKWQLKCCILPMYWLILSTYHTCPKIWNSPF